MTEPQTSSILHPSKLPIPKLKTPPKAQKASSIALSGILYKLIFFIVLIAILPQFPSQAPEFIGESIFTRVWELLHLLFVGIAVSYGIFSQRNADTGMEKDSQQKDESPRSFVSQMLQVSPVFEDEDDSGVVDSKLQTWNSQFYRNEPETLVAKEAGISTKHRLLPDRSIKQRNQEITGRFNQSNYESKAQLWEPRTDSVVLPSPIPWSSRSESTANKVEQVVGSKSTTTLPPHRPSSTSPSPKRLSPSPSLTSDAPTPKSIYSDNNKASPPPAPPPPPPFPPKRKDPAKTSKDESKDSRRKGLAIVNDTVTDLPSLKPSNSQEGPSTGRSVRTFKPKQSHGTAMEGAALARASEEQRDGGDEEEAPNSGSGSEENEVDKKAAEFIARFREQIRLQRIESIKRSTKPRSNRNRN
ncbi:arp2/3 complex-activating protein rickA-like [Zingiber officinale]|uniref:arp2/3 complex-activating protein rickA-like n=1 Tax=Zingiber officinale TaxID=94328 RepID=UPI001C4AC572|nr:arp2/3 complex-activating protein rickA-like [Zingiber officinale]